MSEPDLGASGPRLTHVRSDGSAHMVDVSAKPITGRSASAAGRVLLSGTAVAALRSGNVPKGDALAVARIAGIQAAKRTPDLVPLAHPIAVHAVEVDLRVVDSLLPLKPLWETTLHTSGIRLRNAREWA
jgi:cyclic pyranopterin phosphate synthase